MLEESTSDTQPIRVVLADDQAVERMGIREFLKEAAGPPTDREVEVLRLAAKGLANQASGQALGSSNRTVKGRLANVYGKLGAGSRTEAVTEALKQGWIVIE